MCCNALQAVVSPSSKHKAHQGREHCRKTVHRQTSRLWCGLATSTPEVIVHLLAFHSWPTAPSRERTKMM